MKKKIFLLFILVLIIAINPKIINKINEKISGNALELQSEQNLKIDSKCKIVKYEDNIILYNGKVLRCLDEEGKEKFSLNLESKNFNLYSNKYIDILDKDKDVIFSINKSGKIIFRKKVFNNGLKYASLDNDLYLYAYKDDKKDIINIYDFEGKVYKTLKLKGKLTNITYSNKAIYVCELNTEKNLENIISEYDYNGNCKNKKVINSSIILDIIIDNNNIYLIEKNKITKLDNNLNIKKEFNVNDIKYYSELYKDGFYFVEQNNKVKFISDKIKEISVSNKLDKIDGIINLNNNIILYKDNKIFNKNGEELKRFESNITKVLTLNKSTMALKVDNELQILKIK